MHLTTETPNIRSNNYKLTELKGETDNSIIIVRDFNTLLSIWIT